MADESLINKVYFDSDAIPKDIPDTLDDVDDMTMREQRKNRFSQDTRYRRYLANWVMFIVPTWLVCVVAIVVLCGFSVIRLGNEVIITLLATTTLNVLGLAYIVLKGIYPESKDKK